MQMRVCPEDTAGWAVSRSFLLSLFIDATSTHAFNSGDNTKNLNPKFNKNQFSSGLRSAVVGFERKNN
jgi:hypothetical protein